jgi:hypothetical protein
MDKTPPAGKRNALPMLLMEPDALLRRTVVLTARSLGMGSICEVGDHFTAWRMIRERQLGGAVIALDYGTRRYAQYDLTLIDEIRRQETESPIPIAVMVPYCDAALLQEFRERDVARIILKPFKVRILLDTFAGFLSTPQE